MKESYGTLGEIKMYIVGIPGVEKKKGAETWFKDIMADLVSTDGCLDEDVVEYTVKYYSAMKRWNAAICDNMDLEGIMLSEIGQMKKDKNCVISLRCGI